MLYIHRHVEPHLTELVAQFPAVAVTGPRQCGKSTLLKELFADRYRYITFDDPLVREQAITDPKLLLDTAGERVILDEIQYAPHLLSYVKIAIDSARERVGRFIITGSQQFSLIKNLSDSLAGRIALIELLPFHTEELRHVPHLTNTLTKPRDAFLHACLTGSYPEVNLKPTLDRRAWYGAYVRTYLERDIRTIYAVGELREFQQFMRLLAVRTAQTINLTAYSRELGVSVNTIKRWLSILEASRLVFLLPPYHRNFGKRITKAPKVYFLDCGLVSYLAGLDTAEHILNGPMAGALFETFCIQETVKTLLFTGVQPRLYYLRSYNGLEVDLLLEGKNLQIFPCEIKLTQTPRRDMTTSIQRLKAFLPKLKIGEGRLLCLAEEEAMLGHDVKVQTLNTYWSWLNTMVR